MPRNFDCRALPLLLLPFLLPSCSATTQRTVTGISLCVASFAMDVAIFVASHASVDTHGLLGLAGCEVSEATLGSTPIIDDAEPLPREAGEESSQ